MGVDGVGRLSATRCGGGWVVKWVVDNLRLKKDGRDTLFLQISEEDLSSIK